MQNLLCSVIPGLYFAQSIRVGIEWNSHGYLYLHQDHKLLTYSVEANPKDNVAIYSAECTETSLVSKPNILLPSGTTAVPPQNIKVLSQLYLASMNFIRMSFGLAQGPAYFTILM